MTNDEATPIGAVLQVLLRQSGLDKKVQALHALDAWDEAVGQMAAKATLSKTLEYGVLKVRMISPVWRNEIFLRREEIRQRLNASAGAELIKEIILRS
jgi:predicted nucleic acid-binding Zn ribbon protein